MIVLQFLRETNNTVMILGEIKPYISSTSAKRQCGYWSFLVYVVCVEPFFEISNCIEYI